MSHPENFPESADSRAPASPAQPASGGRFGRGAQPPSERVFHGWYVVAGTFLIAVWSWGLAFYGLSIYLVALGREHGWSISSVSVAITSYYLMGAAVTAAAGDVMRRLGGHWAVAGGVLFMAAGVTGLTAIDQLWQLYAALFAMAVGWGFMSGAAINILIAPWFERKRGVAVSLALTGASGGGIVIAPALLALVAQVGFQWGVRIAALAMVATLLPVAMLLRKTPAQLGLGPDGDPPSRDARAAAAPARKWRRSEALKTRRYWTISIAFATGLAAQVGVITHMISHLGPLLGPAGAGAALSVTTAAAILGRVPMGALADRMDRRVIAGLNFLLQVVGIALLAWPSSDGAIYAGCALFGLGVGNVITLPGLLVEAEFPREHFAGTISLITATNQLAFAFAPGLLGLLRDATGDYRLAYALCAAADLVAAAVVVLGRSRREAKPVSAGLALRPNCECCDCDLPPNSPDAVICSFECTFCARCAEDLLGWRCPNCGGELVRRPIRPPAALRRHPASAARITKPAPCGTVAETGARMS